MKRLVLKAAFAERADVDHAWTAAWTAGERTAAKLAPDATGEMRLEVELDAATEVYDAIRRYQLLRAGPPDPPQPVHDRKSPRRPIRVRARTALVRLINRFRMAARVLFLGHRPATVRFAGGERISTVHIEHLDATGRVVSSAAGTVDRTNHTWRAGSGDFRTVSYRAAFYITDPRGQNLRVFYSAAYIWTGR